MRAIQNFVFCKRQVFFFLISPILLGTNYFLIWGKKKPTLPFYGKTSSALCLLFHMKAVLPSFVAA